MGAPSLVAAAAVAALLSAALLAPSTATAAADQQTAVRISAGSSITVSAGDGTPWSADRYFDGGTPMLAKAAVSETPSPQIFATTRDGMRAYSVPVAPGTWSVRLLMAENTWTSPRKRTFDVSIEGARVLKAFDILAAAGGPSRGVERTFTTMVTDGKLDIAFRAVRDTPSVAGIELAPLSSGSAEPAPSASPPATAGAATSPPLWAEEFDGPAGALPNSGRWGYDWGGLGWGNGELQEYTRDRTQNASTDGRGSLRLVARKESLHNPWSNGAQYTSARITTEGKFSFRYGRAETRAKIPRGQGIWPAFWLLGTDLPTVGWPASGELDIFEFVNEGSTVHSHVHGATLSGGHWSLGGPHRVPADLSDDFHVYAVDWRPDIITFYVDDVLVRTVRRTDLPQGAVWPFDKPHYILLNIAVGGSWPGPPDATTAFPAEMLVDYVRVYP